MFETNKQLAALWEVMRSSERLGVAREAVKDADTVAQFRKAVDDRQDALKVFFDEVRGSDV